MENELNLTFIRNKEDLEDYRERLESTKSSLSIAMIPYLMGKESDYDLLKSLKGEMVSLFKLLNFYRSNMGMEAFTLVYKRFMDKLYVEKIQNISKLLDEGYYVTVNELGGYTPVNT